MNAPPTLAIVIVSWNVRELLRRCLASLEASLAGAGIAHTTIVVDNASADGSPAMVREQFPGVRLIETGANLGFAGGNNVALRALISQGDQETRRPGDQRISSAPESLWPAHSPDYVLLLNPDTEVLGDAIVRLVGELEARPELAAVGPLLRYGDGTVQPSRRRFPGYAALFWESTLLDRAWPANPWSARYHMADRPHNQPQPVGWLVGAALLVRTEAIRRAGLLDERFFMYSEELEWQARIQQSWPEGFRENLVLPELNQTSVIWFLPEAAIIHHEGKSSEQALTRRHVNFSKSKVQLARMWYGWRAASLLRAFLRFGFAYELVIEALKLALGHRPELRRQRIDVYWRVLREL